MTGTGPLVVVGDALLDRDMDGRASRMCPDAPVPVLDDAVETLRPGGAALAALLAAMDGTPVVLVAPLGDDRASRAVRDMLEPRLRVVPVPLRGSLQEKTRFRAAGRTLLRTDSPPGSPGPAGGAVSGVIAAAGALLVSDYGRGVTADPRIRGWLAARAAQVPLLWDPHPRGSEPVPGTRVVTPNHAEAVAAAGLGPGGRVLESAAAAARRLLDRWPADAVAVTLGAAGALLTHSGGLTPLIVPAGKVGTLDTCGAGDRFAAAAATALRGGALTSEAVTMATAAATAFLASGGVATLPAGLAAPPASMATPPASVDTSPAGVATSLASAAAPPAHLAAAPVRRHGKAAPQGIPAGRHHALLVAGEVRAAGGTVVATGGCFDLLHAGHVAMLRAARSLGDCLIVCLNSDASVRRLKGNGRPLNSAADRAAVLAALECVDCVMIFDEDTPGAALDRLRPHVWVKGGDYSGQDLPESAALRRWGGQAVTVPYLDGRSTTRLRDAAAAGGPVGP